MAASQTQTTAVIVLVGFIWFLVVVNWPEQAYGYTTFTGSGCGVPPNNICNQFSRIPRSSDQVRKIALFPDGSDATGDFYIFTLNTSSWNWVEDYRAQTAVNSYLNFSVAPFGFGSSVQFDFDDPSVLFVGAVSNRSAWLLKANGTDWNVAGAVGVNIGYFGKTVALLHHGDVGVVGAYRTTVTNANQGAIYVFDQINSRTPQDSNYTSMYVMENAENQDYLSLVMDASPIPEIHGGTLFACARKNDGPIGTNAGAFNILRFNATSKELLRTQVFYGNNAQDFFCDHVSAFNSRVAVVASPYDSSVSLCGYVKIFEYDSVDDDWKFLAEVEGHNAFNYLNFQHYQAVAIQSTLLAVSAMHLQGTTFQGALSLYQESTNGTWMPIATLYEPLEFNGTKFGYAMEFSGNTLVVTHNPGFIYSYVFCGYGSNLTDCDVFVDCSAFAFDLLTCEATPQCVWCAYRNVCADVFEFSSCLYDYQPVQCTESNYHFCNLTELCDISPCCRSQGCLNCSATDVCADCDFGYNNTVEHPFGCMACALGYTGFPTCTPVCGDGYIVPGEECDLGGLGCNMTICVCMNGWEPMQSAEVNCTPVCGDGVVNGWEECDSGVGCNDSCVCTSGWQAYVSPISNCSVLPCFRYSSLLACETASPAPCEWCNGTCKASGLCPPCANYWQSVECNEASGCEYCGNGYCSDIGSCFACDFWDDQLKCQAAPITNTSSSCVWCNDCNWCGVPQCIENVLQCTQCVDYDDSYKCGGATTLCHWCGDLVGCMDSGECPSCDMYQSNDCGGPQSVDCMWCDIVGGLCVNTSVVSSCSELVTTSQMATSTPTSPSSTANATTSVIVPQTTTEAVDTSTTQTTAAIYSASTQRVSSTSHATLNNQTNTPVSTAPLSSGSHDMDSSDTVSDIPTTKTTDSESFVPISHLSTTVDTNALSFSDSSTPWMGIKPGIVAGVVVGIFIFLTVISLFVALFCLNSRRRRRDGYIDQPLIHAAASDYSSSSVFSSVLLSPPSTPSITFKSTEVPLDSFPLLLPETVDFKPFPMPVGGAAISAVTITNPHKHKYYVRICSEQTDKYSITASKDGEFALPSEEYIDVTLELVVSCTTDLDMRIPVIASLHQGCTLTKDSEHTFLFAHITSTLSIHLDFDEIERHCNPLGEGSFGVVWRAKWRGQTVAVKVMKQQYLVKEDVIAFAKEAELLETLRCPLIVQFIGACLFPGRLSLVTEFIAHGSIESLLKKQKHFSYFLKLRVAQDCIGGLSFLHHNLMMHRDLKLDNLLMVTMNPRSDVVCKLSDFGTARYICHDTMTKGMGTPMYMAPELLSVEHGTKYHVSADIYSYAILLYSLFTENLMPYSVEEFASSWAIAEFVIIGKRLSIPDDCPSRYAALINDCWHASPEKRPTAEDIVPRVNQLIEELDSTSS